MIKNHQGRSPNLFLGILEHFAFANSFVTKYSVLKVFKYPLIYKKINKRNIERRIFVENDKSDRQIMKKVVNVLSSLNYETYQIHCQWMAKARELAEQGGELGEIPVGAIIVNGEGKLIARSANYKERNCDPTAHAEILAIQKASQIKQNWHLNDCTLYVTLEPCPMCAGAIIQSRIKLLVYGADDPKTGAIQTVLNIPDSAASNHKLAVLGGVEELECRQQLQSWFAKKRRK